MIPSPVNPRSAPTQPASTPVRGLARVTQMLGRVATRVRTALTRTKSTTPAKQAARPTRRQPKTTPATPHIDDDILADFCNAETIGDIFASFCRILNIDERSPPLPRQTHRHHPNPGRIRRRPPAELGSPKPPRPPRIQPTNAAIAIRSIVAIAAHISADPRIADPRIGDPREGLWPAELIGIAQPQAESVAMRAPEIAWPQAPKPCPTQASPADQNTPPNPRPTFMPLMLRISN